MLASEADSNAFMESLPDAPSILIILMGALGDVVRGMSVLDAIKAHRPDSHVTWLVEPACAGILGLHPLLDRLVVFDRKRFVLGSIRACKEIRQRQYDVVLDLQRHSKSGFFSLLSGGRRRIGFNRKNAKEGNWLFNNQFIPERSDALPKIQHYQLFLDKLGVPQLQVGSSSLKTVTVSSLAEQYHFLGNQDYMGLVLGSSWESKDWPYEGYQKLISILLQETRLTVLLLGDKSKADMGERLSSHFSSASQDSNRLINYAGKTDLRTLVGFISSARLIVGPDSGPGHIAGAVGTPHITLFGPTPAKRNAPQGSEHLAISVGVGCSPCGRRKCPGLGGICMRLITPERVFDLIKGVLNENPATYRTL